MAKLWRGACQGKVGNQGYVGKTGQLASFHRDSIFRLRRDRKPLAEWLVQHNNDTKSAQTSLAAEVYHHG